MNSSNKTENKENLLLIELNEVNFELLAKAAQELPDCKALKRLLAFKKTTTSTNDVYESDYLEPWVQWVSIHTGKPATEHKVKHLGDVPNLKNAQIWETLSDKGISSGIWGIMNGNRRNAENCRFMIIDPWTFSEQAYPPELNRLVSFAQYIAKNYLNLKAWLFIKHSFNYLKALATYLSPRDLFAAGLLLAEGVLRFGPKNMVLGAFYEYTAAMAFLGQKKKYNPDFSVCFFNLLAHTQHHYWHSKSKISKQLTYAFKVLDRALTRVFSECNHTILVANGFQQINTNEDPTWILYRPKDPCQALIDLGLRFESLEALMTADAHLFFKNESDRDLAFKIMSEANVGRKPLYLVEKDEENPLKLFYRLQFTDEITNDTRFNFNGKSHRFFDYFEKIVVRTGKHSQQGFVLQNQEIMPAEIFNHEIHDYICAYFGLNLQSKEAESMIKV